MNELAAIQPADRSTSIASASRVKWDNILTSPDDDRIFVDGDGEVRQTLASRTDEVCRELRSIVDGVTQIEKKPLALWSRRNYRALEKSSEQNLPES